jgi:hypothetical protein
VVYVAGVYLLARQVGKTNAQVLLIGGFCVLPVYTVYSTLLFPTYTAMCLLPYCLAAYARRFSANTRPVAQRIVLIVLVFFFPYAHILGALMVTVLLVSFEVAVWWRERLTSRTRPLAAPGGTQGFAFAPTLIVFVASLAWFSSFWAFRGAVAKAYQWFWEGIGIPPIRDITLSIEKAGLSPAQIVELLIRSNGQHLIYALLFAVAAVLVVRRLLDRRSFPPPASAIALTVGTIALTALYVATLLGDFLYTGQGERFLQWLLLVTAVLIGQVFGEEISDHTGAVRARLGVQAASSRSNAILVILAGCMVVCAFVGAFNLHYSTLILNVNQQVTLADIVGMAHLFDVTQASLPVLTIEQLPYRSLGALNGLMAMQPDQARRFKKSPEHFGYDQRETLGELYDTDVSIAMTPLTRAMYTELWPYVGWVTIDDLARLPSDPTVSKIYENGEFELWYVSASRPRN